MAYTGGDRHLQEIEGKWSVRELLEEHGLEPRQTYGHQKNCYTHCPFHEETKESFSVHRFRGVYRCFGCGSTGTMYRLLMHLRGEEFPEVVKYLAEKYKVELPTRPTNGQAPSGQRIKAALEHYTNWTQHELTENPGIQDYLHSRGLDDESIRQHRLGYCPPQEKSIPTGNGTGVSYEDLKLAQVIVRLDGHDRRAHNNRITFPLVRSKRVRNVVGRALGESSSRKYMNLNLEKGFWGLDHLRMDGPCMLVEGPIDGILSQRTGVPTAAALGTDAAYVEWIELLPPQSKVYLGFDPDKPGKQAIRRYGELLIEAGLRPYVPDIPEGEDPGSLLRDPESDVLWWSLIEDALPWPVWAIRHTPPEWLTATLDRQKAITWILKPLARCEESLYVNEMLEAVGEESKIPIALLWRYLQSVRAKLPERRAS